MKRLIKLANLLDKYEMHKEASFVDEIIFKQAQARFQNIPKVETPQGAIKYLTLQNYDLGVDYLKKLNYSSPLFSDLQDTIKHYWAAVKAYTNKHPNTEEAWKTFQNPYRQPLEQKLQALISELKSKQAQQQ